MTWDEASRELSVVTFGAEGQRLPHHRPTILVYCSAFDLHRPDAAVLENVRFEVLANADSIRADVEDIRRGINGWTQ